MSMECSSMKNFSKILCALDLSDVCGQVADYAAMQAKLSGAEVVALYVAPSLNQYSDTEMPLAIIKNFIEERVANANKVMPVTVDKHFKGLNVRYSVEVGYPPDVILEMARKEGADLVVIGTHGRHASNATIYGSVAEKVSKQCPVPVLLVRPH